MFLGGGNRDERRVVSENGCIVIVMHQIFTEFMWLMQLFL
jgi:hypothetical protein